MRKLRFFNKWQMTIWVKVCCQMLGKTPWLRMTEADVHQWRCWLKGPCQIPHPLQASVLPAAARWGTASLLQPYTFICITHINGSPTKAEKDRSGCINPNKRKKRSRVRGKSGNSCCAVNLWNAAFSNSEARERDFCSQFSLFFLQ